MKLLPVCDTDYEPGGQFLLEHARDKFISGGYTHLSTSCSQIIEVKIEDGEVIVGEEVITDILKGRREKRLTAAKSEI